MTRTPIRGKTKGTLLLNSEAGEQGSKRTGYRCRARGLTDSLLYFGNSSDDDVGGRRWNGLRGSGRRGHFWMRGCCGG